MWILANAQVALLNIFLCKNVYAQIADQCEMLVILSPSEKTGQSIHARLSKNRCSCMFCISFIISLLSTASIAALQGRFSK